MKHLFTILIGLLSAFVLQAPSQGQSISQQSYIENGQIKTRLLPTARPLQALTTARSLNKPKPNNPTQPVTTSAAGGARLAAVTSTTFTYSGQIDTYTVPAGVTSLTIEARGAEGGSAGGAFLSGKGAIIIGTIAVSPNQQLKILVGQQRGEGNGGGGGSFVTDNTNSPLVIAGGGGGGGGGVSDVTQTQGQAGQAGADGVGTNHGAGGTNGKGGITLISAGYNSNSGGGLLTDGTNSDMSFFPGNGKAFVNGGAGGSSTGSGGFGGGGAGSNFGSGFSFGGGGGGGGYSGGGNGGRNNGGGGGGGGGSYNAGTNPINTAGANSGNGVVIISTPPCVAFTATLSSGGTLTCAQTRVRLTAGGGLPGATYLFNPQAQDTSPTSATATATLAIPYSVTITNPGGCSATATTTVTADQTAPSVSINPSSPTLTCASPSVSLTAVGTGNVEWSTGSTSNPILVTTAGTYSVTLTGANSCTAAASSFVTSNTALAAPSLQASALSTTNQPISVTATGCSGEIINWMASGGTGQANGTVYTVSQPGNYTLTASCSVGTCTSPASSPLALQIRPGGFAITGVTMVNCQLIDEAKGGYQVRFTPQYSDQTSIPINFSVVNELAATTAPAPYSLRLYTDNPIITLVATQAGNGVARFAYNWLASCQSGTSPNQPPTTTGIPSQTILQGQAYQLSLTAYFFDPDGQALSFQQQGLPSGLSLSGSVISGTPSQTGVSTVSITALDPGGLSVTTSFQLTVKAQPVSPPTGFAIVGVSTVSCQVLSAGQRRLTFTPQYAGQSSAPISFSVVNELVATTTPGPYSLNLYTDNPIITLSAQQGSNVAIYAYNWLVVCNPSARTGTFEAGSGLQITVLGNPVEGKTAEVEISGIAGQPVQLDLVNLQGKLVHTQRIEQAGAVERLNLPLGASNGLLLLQVSIPTQRQQVKLLRTN